MRRLLLPGLVSAAALALILLLAFGVAGQGVNTSLDAAVARGSRPLMPAATVALPVLGGAGTRTLASLRGKVVVLNVFASWCQPCQAEAPILERAQRLLSTHDGTVLGVTYLDDSAHSEQFVHANHINYPVVRDVNDTFVHALGSTGVPETFVIDRSGRVAALRRYQLTGDWLQQTVSRLVSG